MTVTHVGSTKKYAVGWEAIFGGGKKSARSTTGPQAVTKKAATKKKAAAKKKVARKK
jgi:hypothetical protein